jgi:hypothetical protein
MVIYDKNKGVKMLLFDKYIFINIMFRVKTWCYLVSIFFKIREKNDLNKISLKHICVITRDILRTHDSADTHNKLISKLENLTGLGNKVLLYIILYNIIVKTSENRLYILIESCMYSTEFTEEDFRFVLEHSGLDKHELIKRITLLRWMSDDFIDDYFEYFNIAYLILFQNISEFILRKYFHYLIKDTLLFSHLNVPEDLIEEHLDKFNLKDIILSGQVSEQFYIRNADRLDWEILINNT